MNKIAIEIPIDWTTENDKKYFEDLLGNSGAAKLLFCRSWAWSIEQGNRVLDRAIKFFLPEAEVAPILDNLSERSKVAVLRRLTNELEMPECLRERVLSDLQQFEDVMAVTEPVFERYTIEPKKVWLRELADAYDLTVGPWALLEETLKCEFPTYRQHCDGLDANAAPAPMPSSEGNSSDQQRCEQWDVESSYQVTANCNLFTVAEFEVMANSLREARGEAEKVLDHLHFRAAARLPGNKEWPLALENDCVETEVVDIKSSTDSDGREAHIFKFKS